MTKIAVVTDSSTDLTDEMISKYGIRVAPMSVTWDMVKYRDGVDLKAEDFYKRLRKSETFPTTSSGIPGEFVQIFEDLKGKADGIVVVALSTGLGISFKAANQAKDMMGDMQIEVVDTQLACAGEGFAALEAARTAEKIGSMEQTIAKAKNISARAHVYFYVDDIEYMRRGGRLNLLQHDITDFQKAKPMMEIKSGKFMPVAVPATNDEAIEKLLSLLSENNTGTPLHVTIEHADNLPAVEIIKKEITSRYKVAELFVVVFSPVIGAHFGPGATGISFFNE
jgi:DegV family protein with EDD domain